MSNETRSWQPALPKADSPHVGLSKREYAAIEILKGLCAATPTGLLPSVRDAITLADNLFKNLEASE